MCLPGRRNTAIAGFEKVTGQKFSEGIKIGARVTINYHPVYGLSLVLCEIDVELTLGGIELRRKETLRKLLMEHPQVIQFQNGAFVTPNKCLALPRVIQRIALITSASSDAYSDFKHSLSNNEHGYHFKANLYNVLVQGYGAQASLYDALSKVRVSKIKYDAAVLTRGGGAPADFLPFDDYHLSLALAQFPIPVITGIGHHTNQGICDFFARVHTKTPTMAAQFIIDHNHTFEKQVKQLGAGIQRKGQELLSRGSRDLHLLKSELIGTLKYELNRNNQELQRKAERIIKGAKQKLSNSGQDLKSKQFHLNNKARAILNNYEKEVTEKVMGIGFAAKQILKEEKQKNHVLRDQLSKSTYRLLNKEKRELGLLKGSIESANPEKILKRGFALLKKDGQFVSNDQELQAGDEVQIVRYKSLIDTEVKRTEQHNGREFKL